MIAPVANLIEAVKDILFSIDLKAEGEIDGLMQGLEDLENGRYNPPGLLENIKIKEKPL